MNADETDGSWIAIPATYGLGGKPRTQGPGGEVDSALFLITIQLRNPNIISVNQECTPALGDPPVAGEPVTFEHYGGLIQLRDQTFVGPTSPPSEDSGILMIPDAFWTIGRNFLGDTPAGSGGVQLTEVERNIRSDEVELNLGDYLGTCILPPPTGDGAQVECDVWMTFTPQVPPGMPFPGQGV